MNKQALRTPYGLKNGKLVHVGDVSRGLDCGAVCPACEGRLVAKKGAIHQPHFAHHAPDPNCSSEGQLHALAKRILYERFSGSLQSGVMVDTSCDECFTTHARNLVGDAAMVVMEHGFGGVRPDLSLLTNMGEPTAFLEVVVTHAPEQDVYDYASNRGIPVVEFHHGMWHHRQDPFKRRRGRPMLPPESWLEELRTDTPLTVDKHTFKCPRPRCECHNAPLPWISIKIENRECWNCGNSLKVALGSRDAGGHFTPSSFTPAQVAVARKAGVILEVRYSRTARARYLANVCGRCNQFMGDFYLIHEGFDPYDEEFHNSTVIALEGYGACRYGGPEH